MSVWQPINTAPKDRYSLIGDKICLPDIVIWHRARPARKALDGTCYMARPEGWFGVNGVRSRLDGKATMWAPVPDYD